MLLFLRWSQQIQMKRLKPTQNTGHAILIPTQTTGHAIPTLNPLNNSTLTLL